MTLGPMGTCHERDAVEYTAWRGSGGKDNAFLLQCSAHPKVHEVTERYWAEVFVVDTFIYPTKALAILSRREVERPTTLGLVPATSGYVDLSRWHEVIDVQSKPIVAAELLAGRYDAGLTHLEHLHAHPAELRLLEEIGEIDTTWVVMDREALPRRGDRCPIGRTLSRRASCRGSLSEVQDPRSRKGGKVRAGAHTLSLLSVPLNAQVLMALEDAPRSVADLRQAVGSPPTTMRGHLRTLTELGILERFRRDRFPGNTDIALGRAGRDLLHVIRTLEDWLAVAPHGPIELGTVAAKTSIRALVEGWSNNIVRAIAVRPLSLTALDRLITSLTYPSLERRLVAMREVGLIAACPGSARGTPYSATDWLRRAVKPLAAAVQWERQGIPNAPPPISRLDVEAAFLLTVPMLTLPPDSTGTCRLAVDMPRNGEHDLAGVIVDVQGGAVLSCRSRLSGPVDAAVTGSARAWLQAVIDRDPRPLEQSGDPELGGDLVDGLHGAFFGPSQR